MTIYGSIGTSSRLKMFSLVLFPLQDVGGRSIPLKANYALAEFIPGINVRPHGISPRRFVGLGTESTLKNAVGKINKLPQSSILAVWGFDYLNNTREKLKFPDLSGHIQGTVKVEGVLRKDIIVRLYYIPNGLFIASTLTNSLGEFRFNNLEVGKDLYDVYAYVEAESFNAVVFHKIRPVNEDNIIPPDYVYVPP